MANNYITDDELHQFKNLPVKKKIDSMEAYLIGVNGVRYNMQEVGLLVFGNENYSYTVSLIHRCYNFSGQNGAKYKNGCKFEKIYGYRVSRRDIEAFVKKYPNGTYDKGITFEDFLKSRVNAANKSSSVSAMNEKQNKVIEQDSKNNDSMEGLFYIGLIIIGILYGLYRYFS